MSKIVITADIHFGVPNRLNDILWACRVMREYCKRAEIDTVLVLGDLYHNRQAIEIDVNNHVCQFFEETKTEFGQNWIVFPGNHDMFLKHSWEINSLAPLRKHLTVIETVKVLKLDNTRFWVVPFIQYEKAYMEVIKSIINHSEFQEGDNLLTHVGVRGAMLNTCFLLKDWSMVNFEGLPFHRIYTGHFHSKQQIGENVWYPGSPIPFKFDEGDVPHGFYVYDLDVDTHKFINIWKAGAKFLPDEKAPPQFQTFLDELLQDKTEVDVAGSLIRVALQRDYTVDEKGKIREQLMQLGALGVRWMDLKVDKDESQKQLPGLGVHKNLFRAWVEKDSKGIKDLDSKILHRLNDEVMSEGDEVYVAEAVEA